LRNGLDTKSPMAWKLLVTNKRQYIQIHWFDV